KFSSQRRRLEGNITVMKKRVLLIGVGLIGGSVALALKNEHDIHLSGYDVCPENVRLAKKMNVIDEIAVTICEEAPLADLIILACPVEQVEVFLEKLANVPLKQGALITDVGSTKEAIVNKATILNGKNVTFIGGHPMAGSHKTGVGSAKAHLFENAFYILTPTPETKPERVSELQNWLRGTKANFIIMGAREHDLITGVVSHFPHVVATSLVRQVENYATKDPRSGFLAAGGFRDMTRIASSSPAMWSDIVKHNRLNILALIDTWVGEMKTVKQLVASGDHDELYDYFSGAKEFRDSLPVQARGAIEAFYDLYVDILDRPG